MGEYATFDSDSVVYGHCLFVLDKDGAWRDGSPSDLIRKLR
jgi:hypothetical protein